MAHRFVALSRPARAQLAHPDGVLIPLRTRAVLFEVATGTFRDAHPHPEPEATSERVGRRLIETPDGPVTELTFEGRTVRVRGDFSEPRRLGRHVFGVVQHPVEETHCVLLTGDALVRLPAQFGAHAPEHTIRVVLGEGDTLVLAQGASVHFLCVRDDGPSFAWLASPVAAFRGALVNGYLRLSGQGGVAVFDLAALPWSREHVATPSHYEVSVCPRDGDDTPAEVRAVLANTVLLEHPRFGTLRTVAELTPPLQKGEQVLLDDVRVEAPDVYSVHALRRPHEPRTLPVAPPRSCAAPDAFAPSPRPLARDAETLRALAARHGFTVPPLLDRVLSLRQSDRLFAYWLDQLDFHFEVDDLTADWHTDPNLVCFGSVGNPALCLYVYPPAQRAGQPAPVVTVQPDRIADFVAADFDGYFEAALSEPTCLEWMDAERAAQLVALVRARLEFPAHDRPRGEAPAWFDAVYTRLVASPTNVLPEPPRVTWLTRRSSLERREREHLARFLCCKRDDVAAGAAALHDVYARLGWSLPVAQLARLRDD